MKNAVKRRIALLLLAVLLLSGCGLAQDRSRPTPAPAEPTPEPSPEPTPDPLDLEDAMIRSAMEREDFGQGDKLAVYIEGQGENGRYSFHGAYLPEELRAQTPEEIGGFLKYRTILRSYYPKEGLYFDGVELLGAYSYVNRIKPSAYGLRLSANTDDNRIWESYDSDRYGNIRMEWVNGSEILAIYNIKAYDTITLEKWLEKETPILLQRERLLADLVRLNEQPETAEFGGGNMLIGYDEDAGLYTMKRVVTDLQATSLEETGYILSYHSTWEAETAYYDVYEGGRWVSITPYEVPVEVCHARILSAVNGQELVSFQARHAPASYSVDDNGIPRGQYMSSTGIWGEMKRAFEEQGLDWPFPENTDPYGLYADKDLWVENPLGTG